MDKVKKYEKDLIILKMLAEVQETISASEKDPDNATKGQVEFTTPGITDEIMEEFIEIFSKMNKSV